MAIGRSDGALATRVDEWARAAQSSLPPPPTPSTPSPILSLDPRMGNVDIFRSEVLDQWVRKEGPFEISDVWPVQADRLTGTYDPASVGGTRADFLRDSAVRNAPERFPSVSVDDLDDLDPEALRALGQIDVHEAAVIEGLSDWLAHPVFHRWSLRSQLGVDPSDLSLSDVGGWAVATEVNARGRLNTVPMYRGMAGDPFEPQLASWTPYREVAERYAEDVGGVISEAQPGTLRGISINDYLPGRSNYEQEFIAITVRESSLSTPARNVVDDIDSLTDDLYARILARDDNPTGIADLDQTIRNVRDEYFHIVERYTDDIKIGRAYTMDAIARGNANDIVMVDGQVIGAIGEPALMSELVGRMAPLPDPRKLRRMFSAYPGLFYSNGDLRRSPKVYDWLANFESGVFKPAILARLAWPIRVVGEEQVRMLAAHHSSMFRDPIHHISLMLGRGGKRGTFRGDALGAVFANADEHVSALAQGSAGYSHGRRVLVENHDVIDVRPLLASGNIENVTRATDAWAEQLAIVAHDPTIQYILRGTQMSADELAEAYWVQMRATRETIATAHPTGVAQLDGTRLDLLTREGSDAYLDQMRMVVDEVTSGDADLIDALRTRTLDGHAMAASSESATISDRFKNALAARQSSMPSHLPEHRRIAETRGGVWAAGTEKMFGWLMAKPTNALSRSPVFRQSYWDEMVALAPRIDVAHADEILNNATLANLPAAVTRSPRPTIGPA
ncbi:MAG: hypothetical protein GY773_00870, partial [Actinomycetia bacterium]|nr:hypothetical protein [Actinomycetes bacterium]